MRNVLWGALLVSATPFLSAGEVAKTARYENAEHRFSMDLPEAWTVKEGSLGSIVTAIAPARGGTFRANLSVSVEELPPLMKMDQYILIHRERLQAGSARFREIESGEVKGRGGAAYRIVYACPMDGTEYRIGAFLIQLDRRVFALTFSCESSDHADLAGIFEKVCASFSPMSPASKTAAPPPATTRRISDSQLAFRIEFPSDWEVRENLSGSTLIAFAPGKGADDPFRENVNLVVEDLDTPLSLEEYTQAGIRDLQQTIEPLQELTVEDAKLGNRPAKRIRYRHRLKERTLEAIAYLAVKDKRGYIVTAAGEAGEFGKHENEFRRICEGLQID